MVRVWGVVVWGVSQSVGSGGGVGSDGGHLRKSWK